MSSASRIAERQRDDFLRELPFVAVQPVEQRLRRGVAGSQLHQRIDDGAFGEVRRLLADEAERHVPLVQDRRVEQRRAHLVEEHLRRAGVRPIEIIDAEAPVDREQRVVVPPVESERVVRRGVRPEVGDVVILEIILVAEQGEVRIQPPFRVIREIQLAGGA